jgi:hypothetical protein
MILGFLGAQYYQKTPYMREAGNSASEERGEDQIRGQSGEIMRLLDLKVKAGAVSQGMQTELKPGKDKELYSPLNPLEGAQPVGSFLTSDLQNARRQMCVKKQKEWYLLQQP